MNKNTKWYDVRKSGNNYSIFFSLSIRLQAIFLFSFSIILFYFQIFEEKTRVNILALLIMIILFCLSFTFSFFVDSFMIDFSKSSIFRKKGIIPFISKQNISFSDIQSINWDIYEKTKNYDYKVSNSLNNYYSNKIKEYLLIIELKNGKIYKISFGKGDEQFFNNFINQLKNLS